MLDWEYVIQWINCGKQAIKSNNKDRLVKKPTKKGVIHVLMNGPSLNDSLKYVHQKKGKVMMVNFALNNTRELGGILPDYYCMLDSICINPKYPESQRLMEYIEKYEKKLYLFVSGKVGNNISINNSNVKVIKVNSNACPKYKGKTEEWLLRNNIAMPEGQGVIILALYVAIQLGYKEIYLHGADANTILTLAVDLDNNLYIRDSHYYEKSVKRNLTAFAGQNFLGELYANYVLFKGLYDIQKYSVACNSRIINMSKDSLIDCYEKFRGN